MSTAVAVAARERPILFSAEMVRAILDGRKTQTRRVVRIPPAVKPLSDAGLKFQLPCPYGNVGDRLWVRENGWEPKAAPSIAEIAAGADTWRYEYDADGLSEADAEDFKAWGWKRRPSIYMPRWASRLTLEITDVRVERLQEISAADVLAEGVLVEDTTDLERFYFKTLWDSLNAKRGFGWDANPWVWVISFKRVTP